LGHPQKKKSGRRLNFSIGERKILYRRKNFWVIPREEKNRRRTFLSAIAIGERTFFLFAKELLGQFEKKKVWRLNFSIRERNYLYRRKNFFSIRERNNLYRRKNFFSIRERTFGPI